MEGCGGLCLDVCMMIYLDVWEPACLWIRIVLLDGALAYFLPLVACFYRLSLAFLACFWLIVFDTFGGGLRPVIMQDTIGRFDFGPPPPSPTLPRGDAPFLTEQKATHRRCFSYLQRIDVAFSQPF